MCNQLLKISQYCLEANQLMVELVQSTAGAESTQVYRARVIELDPYAAFSQSITRSAEVSDASVSLDHLEYNPEDAMPMAPDWGASLGIGLSSTAFPTSDSQPDWLRSSSADSSSTFGSAFDDSNLSTPAAGSASQPDENIPDFLRAAGWGSSTGPEQPYSFGEDDSSAPAADSGLAPADMPDWMKSMAPPPPDTSNTPANNDALPIGSADDGDAWFAGLQAAASKSTGGSDDLFGGTSASSNIQDNSTDWLAGGTGAPAAGDAPDWLAGLGGTADPTPAAVADDTPDWLSSLGGPESAPQASSAQSSNWMDNNSAAGDMFSSTSQSSASADDDMPDWLRGPSSQQSPAPTASISSAPSASEQDDAIGWLESLAAKHGAKPEELVMDPSKRTDKAPDWVNQSAQQPPASSAPVPPAPSASEQDDAIAWLESLASKHGAKPEELVMDPSKRSDVAPDWVQQSTQQPATPAPAASVSAAPSASEQDDAIAWLESLASKHGAKPEELVMDPSKRSDVAPDWVTQSAQQPPTPVKPAAETWSPDAANIGEQFFAEFEKTEEPSATDTTGMWLKGLEDDKPAQKATDAWSPDAANIGEQFFAEFEKPETSAQDTNAWLKSLEDDDSKTSAQQPAPWSTQAQNVGEQFFNDFESTKEEPQSKGLDDWLAGLDNSADTKSSIVSGKIDDWTPPVVEPAKPAQSQGEVVQPIPASVPSWIDDDFSHEQVTELQEDNDLPDWMKGVPVQVEPVNPADWKPAEPAPTSPADWKPVEAAPVQQANASASKPEVGTTSKAKPAPVRNTPVSADGEAPAPRRSARATAAKSGEKAPQGGSMLDQAQGELTRGDIPAALDHYKKLIKKGKNLDEAIHNLRDALYRYPVEVGIWQTLGDAYMRANRLQEALDAYTKAEELLR
jgi:hypothetical protein